MDDVKSIQQPRKKGQKQDSKPTFNMRKFAAINKENGGELISAILFFPISRQPSRTPTSAYCASVQLLHGRRRQASSLRTITKRSMNWNWASDQQSCCISITYILEPGTPNIHELKGRVGNQLDDLYIHERWLFHRTSIKNWLLIRFQDQITWKPVKAIPNGLGFHFLEIFVPHPWSENLAKLWDYRWKLRLRPHATRNSYPMSFE